MHPLAPGTTVDDVLPRQLRDTVAPVPAAAPARIIALCPWLDAALEEGEVRDLEAADPMLADPMLAETGLRAAGRWWAGYRDARDGRVSPMHLELVGLLPVEVFVGGRDILRPAVDTFARRADREGADIRVKEVPAMLHVWMRAPCPKGVAHDANSLSSSGPTPASSAVAVVRSEWGGAR